MKCWITSYFLIKTFSHFAISNSEDRPQRTATTRQLAYTWAALPAAPAHFQCEGTCSIGLSCFSALTNKWQEQHWLETGCRISTTRKRVSAFQGRFNMLPCPQAFRSCHLQLRQYYVPFWVILSTVSVLNEYKLYLYSEFT